MATVEQHAKVFYTVRLSEEEAQTLKQYMQNAMMDEEPHILTRLRESLFHALKTAGVE